MTRSRTAKDVSICVLLNKRGKLSRGHRQGAVPVGHGREDEVMEKTMKGQDERKGQKANNPQGNRVRRQGFTRQTSRPWNDFRSTSLASNYLAEHRAQHLFRSLLTIPENTRNIATRCSGVSAHVTSISLPRTGQLHRVIDAGAIAASSRHVILSLHRTTMRALCWNKASSIRPQCDLSTIKFELDVLHANSAGSNATRRGQRV